LGCSQRGEKKKNNLNKNRYLIDIKIEKKKKKKKNSFYIFGYLLELIVKYGDLEFMFFKIWQIWAIFCMENSLYRLKSYFVRLKFGEILPPKKKKKANLMSFFWGVRFLRPHVLLIVKIIQTYLIKVYISSYNYFFTSQKSSDSENQNFVVKKFF